MTYQDALRALVADAEARAGTVYDLAAGGANAAPDPESGVADATPDLGADLHQPASDAELVAALTAVLLRAEEAGIGLADVALASWLTRELRRAVPVLGLVASPADRAATGRAVATLTPLLADTPDPRARVLRLARGRVTGTSGRYYDAGMAGRPEIRGYRRGLSATACELCQWLYRGGYVYPSGRPMHRHPGCTCVPVPVLTERAAA